MLRRRRRRHLPGDADPARARGPRMVVTPELPGRRDDSALDLRGDGCALGPEDDWALDVDEIERRCGPTRGWCRSTSPTTRPARSRTVETWHALGELCDERGIVLFSDEVYRGLELDPSRDAAAGADLSASALSLNVMSKAYGLPGLRIGWIACRDRAVLRAARTAQALHVDLQLRAERGAGRDRAARAATRSRPATARSSRRTCRCSTRSSPISRAVRVGGAGRAAASASRAISARTASRAMCTELVEQGGVLLLPASIYRSELTATPDGPVPCRPGQAWSG